MDKSYSVGGWVDWDLLDTADSNAVFNGSDLDISLVSPVGSPWVSDNVVVQSWGWVGSISYGSNGVVKLSSAGSRV